MKKKRYQHFPFPTRETPAPVSGSAFVYILACADGAIYVGSAGDLARRLSEHSGSKGAKFTRDNPGVRLIYVEGPLPNTLALQPERQLKRWSRAKKLALVGNQTDLLKKLSQSREPRTGGGADEAANAGQQRLALLKESGLTQHAGDFDWDISSIPRRP